MISFIPTQMTSRSSHAHKKSPRVILSFLDSSALHFQNGLSFPNGESLLELKSQLSDDHTFSQGGETLSKGVSVGWPKSSSILIDIAD